MKRSTAPIHTFTVADWWTRAILLVLPVFFLAPFIQAADGNNTFNVVEFGAVGDGQADDTDAIRAAIQAAGEWADANAPQVATVYFPEGDYAVAPRATDAQWATIYAPAVFVIPTDNMKFLGDGHTLSKISFYTIGMKDPETHWTVTDSSYFKIKRGGAFTFPNKRSLKNITFDGLRISGNADATGNADVGGQFRKVNLVGGRIQAVSEMPWADGTRIQFGQADIALPAGIEPNVYYYIVNSNGKSFDISESPDGDPVDLSESTPDGEFKVFNGDGWDMTHKALFLQAGAWENIVIENCHLDRWRGEIIHGGGNAPKTLVVRNCILEHANSSVISVPSLILEDSIIRYGYNGIENYGRQAWHTAEIRRCQFIATEDHRYGETNAIVFIGMPDANAVFEDNSFVNYKRGVLLSESANNVEIRQNDFLDVGTPVHIVRLGLYPDDPAAFDNIGIHNNDFRTTNGGGNVIYTQFGNISNRNFQIRDNILHPGTESGTWKRLIQEFCWSTMEQREGYLISGNTIDAQSDAFMSTSIRGIWENNARVGDWKYGERRTIYDQHYDGSAPVVWSGIGSNYTRIDNYSSTLFVPVTLDSEIWGKFPEGFTVEVSSNAPNGVALVADSGWNTFSADIQISRDHPVTLVVDANGKFGVPGAEPAQGDTSTSQSSSNSTNLENGTDVDGTTDPVDPQPAPEPEPTPEEPAPEPEPVPTEPAPVEPAPEPEVLEATHYWMFDEIDGDLAVDDGLLPLDLDTAAAEIGEGIGSTNKGLDFNGNHVGIRIPSSVSLNKDVQTSLTISLWVKQDASAKKDTTVVYEQGGYWRGLNILIHRGWVQANGWNRPGTESSWAGTNLVGKKLVQGEWNHIALVLDGGPEIVADGLKLYLNGELVASGDASQLWAQYDSCGLGQVQETTVYRDREVRQLAPFRGSMDDVSVWHAALTETELQDLILLATE